MLDKVQCSISKVQRVCSGSFQVAGSMFKVQGLVSSKSLQWQFAVGIRKFTAQSSRSGRRLSLPTGKAGLPGRKAGVVEIGVIREC